MAGEIVMFASRWSSVRSYVAAHPVGVAFGLAFIATLCDLVSTAYALSQPGTMEANPVVAYGITVGWHYVLFQKIAGLAMSAMAARLMLKLVNDRWPRGWVIGTRAMLAMPALLLFAVSVSNVRLGLMASGAL